MLVSVIIPAFGRQKRLDLAARSAFGQSGIPMDQMEIIIVDDASPVPVDLPAAVTNGRIIRLDHNAGPAGARNAGVEASTGEFIAFLDSDDVWRPEKLAGQLDLAREFTAAHDFSQLVLASAFYMPSRFGGKLELRVPKEASDVEDFAGGCWMCPGTTLFAHRSVFKRTGLFDTRLRRLEDFEWMLRFGANGGQLSVAAYPGAIIAPSAGSKSKPVRDAVGIIRELLARDNGLALSKEARDRAESYLELELTAAAASDGQRIRALIHMLRSVWFKPRLTASTSAFWKRSSDVPGDVRSTYRELLELAEGFG